MSQYVYTGKTPDTLAGGRPVAFGDVVELSRREAGDNARLIHAGLLHPVPDKPEKKESD